MLRNYLAVSVFLLFPVLFLSGQDSLQVGNKEKIKTGIVPAGVPVVAYDQDMGFQYGLIGNLQFFGDGSTYPEYRHQIMVEVSRFTKGSGVNQFFYDSKYLIPGNIRITADVSYLTEKALDFYGFNGYVSAYIPAFTDDQDQENYVSRVFYKHERKLFRFVTDLQGEIVNNKFRWLAGLSLFNIQTATVDIDKLNRGKKKDPLPDTALLYDKYVDWGIIPEKEEDGGHINFVKLGFIYDTRDNESNPAKGLWEEIIVMTAPRFFFNREFAFTKLVLTHRHYVNLISKKLTFAYRFTYQGTIGGKAPFFIQPYLISSYSTATKSDGLGGAKTLRGILRNRVVGDGFLLGNAEIRWKFFKTVLWNQNIYLALHGFADAGTIIQPIDIDKSEIPPGIDRSLFFDRKNDHMHLSYGAGFRIGWNENFIIAVDYGIAEDKRDGSGGLYIGINNLF